MATAAKLTEADLYAAASPFPHIVMDAAFDAAMLGAVADEVAATEIPLEREFYGSRRKARLSDVALMGSQTRALIDRLNGEAFTRWLEQLTGIAGLQPDPALDGGGIHRIAPGGFLKVHSDFNWNERLRLHRRLNLIVYLNRDWDEDWGGELELWPRDMSACASRIAPLFNRMVIFSTTDESYHGHPEPLRCSEGIVRNSIAMYFYTTEPAPQTRFARSVRTNYRARPGERLGLKHKAHQLLMRMPRGRQGRHGVPSSGCSAASSHS